jgi:hypothetical protein
MLRLAHVLAKQFLLPTRESARGDALNTQDRDNLVPLVAQARFVTGESTTIPHQQENEGQPRTI